MTRHPDTWIITEGGLAGAMLVPFPAVADDLRIASRTIYKYN